MAASMAACDPFDLSVKPQAHMALKTSPTDNLYLLPPTRSQISHFDPFAPSLASFHAVNISPPIISYNPYHSFTGADRFPDLPGALVGVLWSCDLSFTVIVQRKWFSFKGY